MKAKWMLASLTSNIGGHLGTDSRLFFAQKQKEIRLVTVLNPRYLNQKRPMPTEFLPLAKVKTRNTFLLFNY